MRSTIRSYHAAGSLSLPLASVFTLSLEAFLTEAEAAFAEALEAEALEAEALEAEALEALEALEEGLVVPAANDPTGWRHTGHVVCGFTVVLANHRRMHAV
jgi:phytoene/squalene synthetase